MNKINKQIAGSIGDITRLSAAVIIDGPYITETDEKGSTAQKFSPRSRKEMKTFEEIVKKAIGFDTSRGDQVNVTNTPFALRETEIIAAERPQSSLVDYIRKAGKPVFNLLLVMVFFILAIRPLRKWLSQASDLMTPAALPPGVDVPQLESPSPETLQSQDSRKKLIETTKENPDMAAEIIRNWIAEVR
jgi:flagellar M-ring protein FliF